MIESYLFVSLGEHVIFAYVYIYIYISEHLCFLPCIPRSFKGRRGCLRFWSSCLRWGWSCFWILATILMWGIHQAGVASPISDCITGCPYSKSWFSENTM